MPCKVQQSVRANCVTYEKGRIYFNYFNTFYNVTREEAKEFLPIIQAFVEGKIIQYSDIGEWRDMDAPNWMDDPSHYRVKPESKYRPFRTQEECWNEMLKHNPFGWVKSKDKGYFHLIGLVQWSSEFEDVMITFATSEQLARSSRSLFEDFTFADGTPFGVKEEE